MNSRVTLCTLALGLILPLVGHAALQVKTTVAPLPDFQISKDQPGDTLLPFDPGDATIAAPPNIEPKELLRLYWESLIAEAKKAGLSDASLKKCLGVYGLGEIPYAAYAVSYKGRPCWLIAYKKLGQHYTDRPQELTHGSVSLIDASSLEILYRDSCYCF